MHGNKKFENKNKNLHANKTLHTLTHMHTVHCLLGTLSYREVIGGTVVTVNKKRTMAYRACMEEVPGYFLSSI